MKTETSIQQAIAAAPRFPRASRLSLRAVVLLTFLCAIVVTAIIITCHKFGVPSLAALAGIPLLGTVSIYTDLPDYSFQSNVTDALISKEGYPVEIVPGTLTVQLLNNGICIGVLFEHLEGSQAWKVNMRGPIKKAISSGAINSPAYVKMTSAGLATAVSGEKCCGIAIFPYVCAQGDQVSYIRTDCIMP